MDTALPEGEIQAPVATPPAPDGSGETPPPDPAPPAEPAAQKSRGDLARDAIYAKASAARNVPGDESTEAMRAAVNQIMHGTEMDSTAAPPPAAPASAAAAPPPPPQKSVPAPLAQTPDTITIKVEGREIAVSAAEVLQRGVATLQKETAADIRLERVTLAEQALAMERAALDRRAAEIEQGRLPQRGAGQAESGDAPPTGRQPPNDAKTRAREYSDALVDGDTEKADKLLERMVAEQVDARLKVPGARPETPSAPPGAANAGPWTKEQVTQANQLFELAFPDVLAHPMALAQASARMQYEMANPVNRAGRVDLATVAARIGNDIRRSFQAAVPQPPPASGDELAARRTLAARVPGVPVPASPRTISAEASAPTRASPSDVVQQMRKARGQA